MFYRNREGETRTPSPNHATSHLLKCMYSHFNQRIFVCIFFDPGVPIRAKMDTRRTEAIFPFPMSIAVLRARAPHKFANRHRISRCGDSIQGNMIRLNFRTHTTTQRDSLMLFARALWQYRARVSSRFRYAASGAGANVEKKVAKKPIQLAWKHRMCGSAKLQICSSVAWCSASTAQRNGFP